MFAEKIGGRVQDEKSGLKVSRESSFEVFFFCNCTFDGDFSIKRGESLFPLFKREKNKAL